MHWYGVAAAAFLALLSAGGGRGDAPGRAQEHALKKGAEPITAQGGATGRLRIEPAAWVEAAPYAVKVLSASDGRVVASLTGKIEELPLPPGAYRIVWRQSEHDASETDLGVEVAVSAGETASVKVDTGIRLVPAKWLKAPPYYWVLRDPASGKEIVKVGGTWDAVPAPAGIYTLWYRQWEHGSSEVCLARSVTVARGKCLEVDVNTGLAISPSEPGTPPPYRWVLIAKRTGKEVITVNGERGPVPVPPGIYSLRVQQTEHGHSLSEFVPEFVIQDGQRVELTL